MRGRGTALELSQFGLAVFAKHDKFKSACGGVQLMIDLGSLFCKLVRFVDGFDICFWTLFKQILANVFLRFTPDKQGSDTNLPRSAKFKHDQAR